MSLLPKGAGAVMAGRKEPADSLDFFPTPPWATRAVLPILRHLGGDTARMKVWEPACGEGHMSEVLGEAFEWVCRTDVHPYGYGAVEDFLNLDLADDGWPIGVGPVDWIVTNPPFKAAVEFAEVALALGPAVGVALLVRTAWLEGGDRWGRLFDKKPPSLIAQYAERVPMTKGRWDPEASTATAYCWVIWVDGGTLAEGGGDDDPLGPTRFTWIPPGRRRALSKPEDLKLAAKADAPLLDGGAA